MEMGGLLTQVASTGLVGVFLVIALFALRQRDAELQAEKGHRITDAAKYLELALELQKDVIVAVKTLGEIVEKWEKREEAREREEMVARAHAVHAASHAQLPLPSIPEPPPTKRVSRP